MLCVTVEFERISLDLYMACTTLCFLSIKLCECIFLPGLAQRPRDGWVLKKRMHGDLIDWLLCSFRQETPLNTGAEQLVTTTRRRLAMVQNTPHNHTPGGAEQDRQHSSWGRDTRDRWDFTALSEGEWRLWLKITLKVKTAESALPPPKT